MDKESLMLHGAAYAVLQMVNAGSWCYRKIYRGRAEDVEWQNILDYLLSLIEEKEVNDMSKEVKPIMLNGCWADVHEVLKLLKRSIDAAYHVDAITGKEYLMMKDLVAELINMFVGEEVDYENCD